MDGGRWIKLYGKFLEWEWWDDPVMVKAFIYLLLNANYKDSRFKGIAIKRGQIVTGYHKLSEELGLSFQQTRTVLSKLKSTNEITIKATNKYSVITICKYEDYQKKDTGDQQAVQQSKQQTISKQKGEKQQTINNNLRSIEDIEDKNIHNVFVLFKNNQAKTLNEKEKVFANALKPFVDKYGKQMIREFYDYWRQTEKTGTRLLLEKEDKFHVNRRLGQWYKKEIESGKPFKRVIPEEVNIPDITKVVKYDR